MAHHKRKKAKNQRAGCLMCKPNKMNGWSKRKPEVLHQGFGPIRDKAHAEADLKDELNQK
jgi:hypothetical protein